jgi:hypothetical protein
MSNQIKWLFNNFYGVLNISGNKNTISKRTKKAGLYSDEVSVDTRKNLKNSSIKVGNSMRSTLAELV